MSDYKPITGELMDTLERGKCTFTNSAGFEQVNVTKIELDSTLDAIDAIHAQLEEENERLHRELRDRPIAVGPDALETVARLERENANLNAVNTALEEANDAMRKRLLELTEPDLDGWIELPKDADGVPIHVGDVMVYTYDNTCPLPVVALVPPAVFLTDDGPRYADMCRHAPDTWERILNESYMRGVKAQQEAQMDARERGTDAFVSSVEIPDDYDLVARCRALCERAMTATEAVMAKAVMTSE